MRRFSTRRTLSNMTNLTLFHHYVYKQNNRLVTKSRRSITLGKISLQYTMTTMNKILFTSHRVNTIRNSVPLRRLLLQKRVTYNDEIISIYLYNGYTRTRRNNDARRYDNNNSNASGFVIRFRLRCLH